MTEAYEMHPKGNTSGEKYGVLVPDPDRPDMWKAIWAPDIAPVMTQQSFRLKTWNDRNGWDLVPIEEGDEDDATDHH